MGVAARSVFSKRSDVREQKDLKEGKRVSKWRQFFFFLIKLWVISQTVTLLIGMNALFTFSYFLSKSHSHLFCLFWSGWFFAIITVFLKVQGVEQCVIVWLIFIAATENVGGSYASPPVWISAGRKASFPEVLLKPSASVMQNWFYHLQTLYVLALLSKSFQKWHKRIQVL